jgi:hypothetical protein
VARAQQPAMPVIGYLGVQSADFKSFTIPFFPGPERNRLCCGPERGDRIPLGGKSI